MPFNNELFHMDVLWAYRKSALDSLGDAFPEIILSCYGGPAPFYPCNDLMECYSSFFKE
jgi:hypothetical protein